VVGRITNVSISAALRNGITGDGIIMYLEQYASPRMKRNEQTGRALPQTVVGQIRLWEAERNRFSVITKMMMINSNITIGFDERGERVNLMARTWE